MDEFSDDYSGSNEYTNEDSDNISGNKVNNLGDDWIPECPTEKKPYLGQIFLNLESALTYYRDYGRLCGFDVRCSSHKRDPRTRQVIRKYFVCSRAGLLENDEVDNSENKSQRRRRTVSAKCMCPAMIAVVMNHNQTFSVQKFSENHNHSFTSSGGMQFLRCSRSLKDFHKRFVIDAAKSNIGATRAHAIFKSMIGSYEDVGATVVDFKNFARDIKGYIGKHDSDMIIQKFRDIQESSDKNFRFEYRTDSENHLTQLFWVDGIGRRNYEVLGDVVSFDATYRTNRYGMVFIPLIGIDNHWKSVTFAGILLEKEDTDNYTWACEVFKKIFVQLPKCIITDQDPALKIAIEQSFPGVKHRWCMWHIMKKFPAKLGTLFCAESPFMDKINSFVWNEHISPEEFEEGWNNVVEEFELSDNTWLRDMYDLRTYWIPAYFNDEPMVGLLRTTSRSESSNFYFNHFVQKGDTLSEFYLCYHSAIEKQRNNQAKLKHNDDIMPRIVTKKKIEKDAAEIYTRSVFYKIQGEIIAGCGDIEIQNLSVMDNVKTVHVTDQVYKNKVFEVRVNLQTHDVVCSCKLYTRIGYLCSHCFFCLGISGIPVIPRQYVTNRWLKRADERFSTLQLGEISIPNSTEDEIRIATSECWFEFQSCISEASGQKDSISYLSNGLKAMRKHLQESCTKGNTRLNDEIIENLIDSVAVDEITIQNPNKSNNKGCRKRIVGGAEKTTGKNKRTKRECKTCHEMQFHDSRNCPSKFKK